MTAPRGTADRRTPSTRDRARSETPRRPRRRALKSDPRPRARPSRGQPPIEGAAQSQVQCEIVGVSCERGRTPAGGRDHANAGDEHIDVVTGDAAVAGTFRRCRVDGSGGRKRGNLCCRRCGHQNAHPARSSARLRLGTLAHLHGLTDKASITACRWGPRPARRTSRALCSSQFLLTALLLRLLPQLLRRPGGNRRDWHHRRP